MHILLTAGWFVALLLGTIIAFNLPMSALTYLFGRFVLRKEILVPKMPLWVAAGGMAMAGLLGGLFVSVFDAEPGPVRTAVILRCLVYLLIRY